MKQWLVKGTMATLLASSTFLGNTAVFADSGTMDGGDKVAETEAPSLVQGDFFYFVKTMVEKIQLALETNDLEQAKLLSEFAAERIAEAEVLIQEGKDEAVTDTLNRAAENLEKADELSGEAKAETEEATEEAKAETEEATEEAKAETEEAAEEVKAETEEATKEATEEKEEVAKVKAHIGHNVEALAKVLDKVKNPKAKAAIAKNIEKSFAKLANRIEKIQEKQELVIIGEDSQADQNTQPDVAPETPQDVAEQLEKAQPAVEPQATAETEPAQQPAVQPVQEPAVQPVQKAVVAPKPQVQQPAIPAPRQETPAYKEEKAPKDKGHKGNEEPHDNGKKIGHEKQKDKE
ncbi:MAG: DUF5667 domain-containing protein [Ectobacillus sp.]